MLPVTAGAQQLASGDLMLIETALPGVVCPATCFVDIVVQSPAGGTRTQVGTHTDGLPAQITETLDGASLVAHAPKKGPARVDVLIDASLRVVREEQALAIFTAAGDSRVTGVATRADGSMWFSVRETPTASTVRLYRREPDGRIMSELKDEPPMRSLQMKSDQCTLMWLRGSTLMSYDVCFKLPPAAVRTFASPNDFALLPDGGLLVVGATGIQRYGADGKLTDGANIEGSTGQPTSVSLTPDGTEYWVGTSDGLLRKFSLARNRVVESTFVVGRGISELSVVNGWIAALDAAIAPTELAVGGVSARSADLVWRDLSRKESGYEVQVRTTTSSTWVPLTMTAPGGVATVSGLLPDTEYLLRIRTITPWGVSDWSNVVQLRTTQDQPEAPSRRRGVPRPGAG